MKIVEWGYEPVGVKSHHTSSASEQRAYTQDCKANSAESMPPPKIGQSIVPQARRANDHHAVSTIMVQIQK
jgi:hypothetical protein